MDSLIVHKFFESISLFNEILMSELMSIDGGKHRALMEKKSSIDGGKHRDLMERASEFFTPTRRSALGRSS